MFQKKGAAWSVKMSAKSCKEVRALKEFVRKKRKPILQANCTQTFYLGTDQFTVLLP
jgi:hypothetical protein